jgi:hypothetical protein
VKRRFSSLCLAAAIAHGLIACSAVRETGDLLYKDTATDSFDGRYPGFSRFLNRVSDKCGGYPIGDGNLSSLIGTDANMIDALSRLFERKISPADFSDFLGGWYPGTDTSEAARCAVAELPEQPPR